MNEEKYKMSVKAEKLEGSMVKLTITESAEDFDKAIEKVYQKQKHSITAPGFRKGKVPMAMVEKLYGEGVFYEDAANDMINSTYPEEAEASGEEITSSPKIGVEQIGKGREFIYTAEVAVKPPVTLGKYKDIDVTKHDLTVTDEEVMAEINKELDKSATYKDVTDREVKSGDEIKLDYEGSVDGVAFDGGKASDAPLTIGSGSFIPGFEEQLVGAKIGAEKEIKVTFPEHYQSKDLEGKEATFNCKVNSIREKVVPELDDEFADEKCEKDGATVADYKEEVKAQIEAKKIDEAKTDKENEAIEKIIEDAKIEIPEAMINTQVEQMIDEWGQRFQQQGLSLEQYFQYTGSDRKKMGETLKPEAEKRIKTRLCLEQIAKDENIKASDEDYEAEIKKMADQYKMEVEKVKGFIDEKSKEQMMKDIEVQKALDLVADSAKETLEKKSEDDKKED